MKNVIKHVFFVFVLLVCLQPSSAQTSILKYKNGNYQPKGTIEEFISSPTLNTSCKFGNSYIALMQFKDIPDETMRQKIRQAGILLEDYIPDNAYYISMPLSISKSQLDALDLAALEAINPFNKTEETILKNEIPSHAIKEDGKVDLNVQYYSFINKEEAEKAVSEYDWTLIQSSLNFHQLVLRIPISEIKKLTALSWVKWIEPIAPPAEPVNYFGTTLHRDNYLQSGLAGKLNLTGSGVGVAEFDGGASYKHLDIAGGRLKYAKLGSFYHATHVAGTILGAGNRDPNAKGMAPKSDLYTWNWNGSVMDTVDIYYKKFGYYTTSNSWGFSSSPLGTYNNYSVALDAESWKQRYLCQVWAAANDGTAYKSIRSGYNSAKDNICVGATLRDTIAYFSSRGPTQDGRLKPDVCSSGQNVYSMYEGNIYSYLSGTSMATPGMSGTIALLDERFKQNHGGKNPSAAVMKAIVCNTAFDMGNPGPDFIYGYGRVDAVSAERALTGNLFLEDSLKQKDTFRTTLSVPANMKKFKVMICWMDTAGSASINPNIVNDIDLKVITPSGTTTLPWVCNPGSYSANATRAIDTLNVSEQVTFDNPSSGKYTVLVIGKKIPKTRQRFALTWKIDSSFLKITSPIGRESFSYKRQFMTSTTVAEDTNDISINWEAEGTGKPFDIYFSADSGKTWKKTGTAPSFRRDAYWPIPDTFSTKCLFKITSGSFTTISDSTFTILETPKFSSMQACKSMVMLKWNAIKNSVSYDVMKFDSSSGKWSKLIRTPALSFIDTVVVSGKYNWYALRAVAKDGGMSNRSIAMPVYTVGNQCFANFDAGILNIDSPINFCSAGTYNVVASIQNFGIKTLNSANIDWQINGVGQSTIKWTGSLGSGSSEMVKLGTITVASTSSYSIKVWTSKPNGTTDGGKYNDTFLRTGIKKALGGTYTIGASGADYKTIKAAINDLVTSGVCSPITFNIMDGSYNERVVMPSIWGASKNNTVTFQSKSKDSSKVEIYTQVSNSNDSGVINLKGCSYVTFRQVTIKRTGSSALYNGGLVWLSGTCTENHIENCVLEAYKASNTNYPWVYAFNSDLTNNKFINNLMLNGTYYGLYFYNSSGTSTGTSFINNTFDGFAGYYPAYFYRQDNIIFSGNTLKNFGGNTPYATSYFDNCNGGEITKNKLLADNAYYTNGFYLYYCNGASLSTPFNISNNFIYVGGTGTLTSGIYIYNCTNTIASFNNINIQNRSKTAFGLYVTGNTKSNSCLNNIVVNTGGGQTVSMSASSIASSNYNNFFVPTSSNTLGNWNGASCKDMSAWKTASSQDSNSLSVDPRYKSSKDLHVLNTGLYQKGISISGITDDIDGQNRNSIPCIGADEIIPQLNDAGISTIDSPYINFCPATRKVYATLYNYGIDTLKSATINWEVNGTTMSPISWTGSLSNGTFAQIVLGTFTFKAGNTYSLNAWTSKPNGKSDGDLTNDTVGTGKLMEALGGTYTIGGSNPDYKNFTLAVKDLKTKGVCGPVVFNVRDGSYQEKIKLNNILGISPQNTITFQSQSSDSSKVSLNFPTSSNTDSGVVTFDEVSWINFKQITIERTGSGSNYYGTILYFINNAYNISISGCRLMGVKNSNYSYAHYLVFMTGVANNNKIIGNSLKYGAGFMIYLYGNSNYAEGNSVIGNLLDSFYGYYPVYATNHSKLTFKGNTITNPIGSSPYGSLVFYSCNQGEISQNKLIVENAYNTYGIYVANCSGTSSNPFLIVNNFVFAGGTGTMISGIYNYLCSNTLTAFNNVNIENTTTTAGALVISGNTSNTNTVINNNLVNKGGGLAVSLSANEIAESNYNNFYVSSASNYLGTWSGTNCKDLSAWKATSLQDSNSVSVDPKFKSSKDLHILNSGLYQKGKKVAGVTGDIDGQIRNKIPCIGADEIIPKAIDAGINSIDSPYFNFCPSNRKVYVTLFNYGIDTLKSATINWEVNGVTMTTAPWTGLISNGGFMQVYLDTFTFKAGNSYTIKAWTSKPNGKVDGDAANDTALSGKILEAMGGTFTIGGSKPDYKNFTLAVNALMAKGVCGPVVFNVRDGSYPERIRFTNIPGSSAQNTITFQSQSGDSSKVSLNYPTSANNDTGIVIFDKTAWINFKKITIQRTGSTSSYYGTVLYFINNSSNINISGCRLMGVKNPTYHYYFHYLVYMAGTNNNNRFTGNTLKYGANYMVFLGGTNGTYSLGNVFEGNLLDSFYGYYPFYASYHSQLTFRGNTVSNLMGSYPYGNLYFYSCGTSEISSNRITYNNAYYTSAISLNYCNGTSTNPIRVFNNFISIGGSGNLTSAIYSNYSNYTDITFNNINITNSTYTGTGLYLNASYTTTGLRVLNNCVSNSGGGTAVTAYYPQYFSRLDFNNYYVPASSANLGYAYTTTGSYYSNLSKWQAAVGKDSNSISIDPKYFSKTDLHISELALQGKGVYVNGVLNDYDGEKRETKPTIGADELPISVDVNVSGISKPDTAICEGTYPVEVSLYNFSKNEMDSVEIKWLVDGNPQKSILWNDTLKGKTGVTNVFLGNFYFGPGKHTIVAYTYMPNGKTDVDSSNDTSLRIVNCLAYPSAKTGGNKSICYGNSIQVGDSAVKGNTYLWSSVPSGFSSSSSNPVFKPMETTKFILIESNPYGCYKKDSITITVNPIPYVLAGKDTTFCEGNSASIGMTAQKGHLYSWSSVPVGFSSTKSIVTVNPTQTTTYTLTATDSTTGCSDSSWVTITVLPVPNAYIGKDSSICLGQQIKLGGSSINGHSYSWSSNPVGLNDTNSSITITPTLSTTYYLTETNLSTLCTKTNSVKITVNPLPTLNLGKDKTICSGDSVEIVGSNQYSFKWNNGATTSTIWVKNAGDYIQTVTNKNGCETSDTVHVTENQPPAKPSITQNVNNLSSSATQGNTWYKFSTKLSDTTQTIKAISDGKYVVWVTDKNGCSSSSDSFDFTFTGLESNMEKPFMSVKIYPNPFKDEFKVGVYLYNSTDLSLEITDLTGRNIEQKKVTNLSKGFFETEFRNDDLSSGVYFLKVSSDQGSRILKVVKE